MEFQKQPETRKSHGKQSETHSNPRQCADFIDVTSPVGEAWEVVQEEIARLKKELEAQRGELKNALNRIANYAPQGDLSEEDKKLLIKRDEVLEDIKNCEECARAREINTEFVSVGARTCPAHYNTLRRLTDSIEKMQEYKEIWGPRNIAREAFAKLEEK